MQDLFWTQNKYSILLHGVQVLASPCKLLLPISAGNCFCQWNGTCSINSESNINKEKGNDLLGAKKAYDC